MKGYRFTLEVTAAMIHELHLKKNDLLVFALLDYFTKKYGYCYHPASVLADMLDVKEYTILTCIRTLSIIHYIEIDKVVTSDNKALQRIRTIV